jgi:hypothetical protein
MKVRWYVVFLVGLNLALGLWDLSRAGGGGVAYLAHLGGLFVGYLYLRFSAAHGIDRLRRRMSALPDVPDEAPRAIPRSQPRSRERTSDIDDIVARSNAMAAQHHEGATPTLTSKVGKKKTDELNYVLDKISERGIESLTSDERRLLEEMSKKLRRE